MSKQDQHPEMSNPGRGVSTMTPENEMASENVLFPEIADKAAINEPQGFRYQDDILTMEEETDLAAAVGQLGLRPFEFHGHLGNRRVVSFGLTYDYARRTVEQAAEIPPFLNELLARVADFSGYAPDAFRQVGVNEYRAAAGIGWHKDKAEFGIIAGVSLLAPATMRFRKKDGARWERVSHILRPRSIYMLSEAARTVWEHSIPPVAATRYSITFRTLSDMPRREKRK